MATHHRAVGLHACRRRAGSVGCAPYVACLGKGSLQPLVSEALRAGSQYTSLLCRCLREGTGRTADLIPSKRRLETANSEMFASLRRIYGEPKNRAEILQEAAAAANGNLRLTRILNLLLVHLASKPRPVTESALSEWEAAATSALDLLASAETDEASAPLVLSRLEAVELSDQEQTRIATRGSSFSWRGLRRSLAQCL